MKKLMMALVALSLCGCDGFFGDFPDYEEVLCAQNERIQDDSCVQCPAGTTNEAGDKLGSGNTQCDPTICQENQRVEANKCVACPEGTSRSAGDDASGADTMCSAQLCQVDQRVQDNACVACQPGQTNMPGDPTSGPDTSCDGQLCAQNQRVESNVCVACSAGTINDPSDDPAGSDTTCDAVICKENENVEGNRCFPCKRGTTNQAGDDASGSDTMCDEVVCQENQRVQDNACQDCPAGTTRPAGDKATEPNTECIPTLCGLNQRVQSNACIPCEGGLINEAGDDASGSDTFCQSFKFISTSLGYAHTCGLSNIGKPTCWGSNASGQLGDGTTEAKLKLTDVQGLVSNVTQLESGAYHSCVLTDSGGVKCWGRNDFGQLGNNSTSDSSVPVDVQGLGSGVIQIKTGSYHTCALTMSALKCWGRNDFGQLGNNSTSDSSVPVDVQGLGSDVADVFLGGHSCAVMKTGSVKCWGRNQYGQLGDGSKSNSSVPVDVQGLNQSIKQMSLSSDHSCAVNASSSVQCWGRNTYGQLGDNTVTDRTSPVAVGGLQGGMAQVGSGDSYSCALSLSGAVLCWGRNTSGRLGDGSNEDRFVPVQVVGLANGVSQIGLGIDHTCALTSSGEMKCWGNNSSGRLGNDSTVSSNTPVNVRQR